MALAYVHAAVFLIVHLVGLVVAIVLLIKFKGTPAILATVAFALGLIQDVGQIARGLFLDRVLIQQIGVSDLPTTIGGLNCCCGILNLIGLVCLIIAIWQAVSSAAQQATEGEAKIS